MEIASKWSPSKRLVPAIDRAAAVLDLITVAPGSLGVSEIARSLGLPKSSVHGICETLLALELLRNAPTGYVLGPRSLRWASSFLERSSLIAEFHALIANEPVLAEYTTTLSILENDDVVYLACRNSNKPLGFTFQVGQRLPSVFTATGKAMLAALSSEERAARLPCPWPRPLTSNSVTDAESFEAQSLRWRVLGHAVDNGEIREGMTCLGAAILDARGRPIAGIAVSLTCTEARRSVREQLSRALARVANHLSRLSDLGAEL